MSFFGDFFRDPFDDIFARRLDHLFTPTGNNQNPSTLLIGDTNDPSQTQSNTTPATQSQLTTTTAQPTQSWQSLFRAPRLDLSEQPTAYLIKVDLPGLPKEQVDIHVEEGNILSISGERKDEREESGEQFYRKERSYGKFERRVRLPVDAKLEDAKASMVDGVLRLEVPKAVRGEERRKISVE
ncbi:hypothetical protein HK097_000514 [Rhizophlyctis rosea]|uniref:SHSP domain-containing protein n=1 Tax=Rhizophlyctis rosea TaxID=64517 RepID=A0AAD5X1D9_9FUNG|nr:hypothetical protein HK097_000514 [Rhizophlyctis rosea]